MADPIRFAAEEATISDDIEDFIEENNIKDIGKNVNDYDSVNKSIEELRSVYWGKHNKLKTVLHEIEYKDKYEVTYMKMLDIIKGYIKELTAQRRILRDEEDLKDIRCPGH